MNILNQYFDHIYCINLDRRPDKWEEASRHFEQHNLIVERVSAVDGNDLYEYAGAIPSGAMGCNLSHVKVLKDIVQNGYHKALILEDDVILAEGYSKTFEAFADKFYYVSWDMLYLSGSHQFPPLVFADNIYRAAKTFTTHAYGITHKMAGRFIPLIENQSDKVVDEVYAENHHKIKAYCFQPQLAIQSPGYSDIRNEHVDYTQFFKNE